MRSSGRLRFYIYPVQLQQSGRTSSEYEFEDGWAPPTDVYETEKALVIKMAIAGIDRKDIRIQFSGDRIILMGRRIFQKDATTVAYHQMEIRSGKFKRVIRSSIPLDSTNIHVNYDNGLLTVYIPKEKQRRHNHMVKITF